MDGRLTKKAARPVCGPTVRPGSSLAVLLFVALLGGVLSAQDIVVFRGPNGREVRRKGAIVEFRGDELILQWSTGREEPIKAGRIVRMLTQRHKSHLAGWQLMERGEYEKALPLLRQAVQEEKRAWMQREIVAGWVRCYFGLTHFKQAGDTFLRSLLASDKDTHHFSVIPLAWRPHRVTPELHQQAQRWLGDRSPVAQLLGASWLLSTAQRAEAVRVLQILARGDEVRVALLAECQLWKSRLATASEAEVTQWQQRVKRLPLSHRPGPYFVIGQALARLKKPKESALVLMRIPVLYSESRPLANEALLLAGRQLEQLNQINQARGLYREVILKAPNTFAAADAKNRLETLLRSNKKRP